jgi:N-acetylneuraminic acid mutarotase
MNEKEIFNIIENKGEIPTARWGHTGTLINNSIIIFGGWDGENVLNDLYVFNLEKGEWNKIHNDNDICPSSRAGHTASLISNNEILIFAGYLN